MWSCSSYLCWGCCCCCLGRCGCCCSSCSFAIVASFLHAVSADSFGCVERAGPGLTRGPGIAQPHFVPDPEIRSPLDGGDDGGDDDDDDGKGGEGDDDQGEGVEKEIKNTEGKIEEGT